MNKIPPSTSSSSSSKDFLTTPPKPVKSKKSEDVISSPISPVGMMYGKRPSGDVEKADETLSVPKKPRKVFVPPQRLKLELEKNMAIQQPKPNTFASGNSVIISTFQAGDDGGVSTSTFIVCVTGKPLAVCPDLKGLVAGSDTNSPFYRGVDRKGFMFFKDPLHHPFFRMATENFNYERDYKEDVFFFPGWYAVLNIFESKDAYTLLDGTVLPAATGQQSMEIIPAVITDMCQRNNYKCEGKPVEIIFRPHLMNDVPDDNSDPLFYTPDQIYNCFMHGATAVDAKNENIQYPNFKDYFLNQYEQRFPAFRSPQQGLKQQN